MVPINICSNSWQDCVPVRQGGKKQVFAGFVLCNAMILLPQPSWHLCVTMIIMASMWSCVTVSSIYLTPTCKGRRRGGGCWSWWRHRACRLRRRFPGCSCPCRIRAPAHTIHVVRTTAQKKQEAHALHETWYFTIIIILLCVGITIKSKLFGKMKQFNSTHNGRKYVLPWARWRAEWTTSLCYIYLSDGRQHMIDDVDVTYTVDVVDTVDTIEII